MKIEIYNTGSKSVLCIDGWFMTDFHENIEMIYSFHESNSNPKVGRKFLICSE